jgi:hypothetical protein
VTTQQPNQRIDGWGDVAQMNRHSRQTAASFQTCGFVSPCLRCLHLFAADVWKFQFLGLSMWRTGLDNGCQRLLKFWR